MQKDVIFKGLLYIDTPNLPMQLLIIIIIIALDL